MPEVKDAIDQLANKQYDQFRSTVSDLLMDRLKGRIDNEKYNVGQSVFADQESESDDEDIEVDSELEDGVEVEPEIEEEQPEETSDEEV